MQLIEAYYFGEFGYFALTVIGRVERFITENPDIRLMISTFKDYGLILKLLFPNNIEVIREYNGIELKRYRYKNELTNNISLDDYKIGVSLDKLKLNTNNIPDFIHGVRGAFLPSKKIIYGQQKNKNLICISARFREHVCDEVRTNCVRDLPQKQWDIVIKHLRKVYPESKIVLVGRKTETLPTMLNQYEFISGIYNQINVLNCSKVLVTTPSGFGEFAVLCGCPWLCILPKDCSIAECSNYNNKINYQIMKIMENSLCLVKH